jgi:ComF family protein
VQIYPHHRPSPPRGGTYSAAGSPLGRIQNAAGVIARCVVTAPTAALRLVFPTLCAGCRTELDDRESCYHDVPVCNKCLTEFNLHAGPACKRCGAALPKGVTRSEQCPNCSGRRFQFQTAIAAGGYGGSFREVILDMKRAEGNWISLAMGRLVWARCQHELTEASPGIVMPVPMHWRRRIVHGTNSAALLAEVFAQGLRKPLVTRLLRRRRHTVPQFSLSPPQRRANVRGCFAVRPAKQLQNAHVLLVDDIMTSGATCNEAARVLRHAGASRVTVVVVARATGE